MSLIQNRKTKRQVKRGYLQSASLLAHNTISCYHSISEGVCPLLDSVTSFYLSIFYKYRSFTLTSHFRVMCYNYNRLSHLV